MHLQKQHDGKTYRVTTVVNCFQFSIFAFAKTTNSTLQHHLWNVVNCFQFSIFAFAKTTQIGAQSCTLVLWIAFNLVSLHLQKQPCNQYQMNFLVVNCFQFSIFAFAKTTELGFLCIVILLWIAFNLVSLHLQKQQKLSRLSRLFVVNCFQFSIFAFAKTTRKKRQKTTLLLWIAFNLVSLHLQKQLAQEIKLASICCELLSI